MKRNQFIMLLTLTALSLSPMSILFSQRSPWEPMNRGLLHLLVYTIEIDPIDPLILYAGTEYGNLYKSTDGGFNWIISRNGIPSNYNSELVSALYVDRNNPAIIYAGFGGRASTKNLFKSTDAAASWNVIPTPSEWKNGGILNIYQSYGLERKLFCGLGWSRGIYSTIDELNWNLSLSNVGVQVIAGPKSNSEIILAGFSGKPSLNVSINGGHSWSPMMSGIISKNGMSGVRAITYSEGVQNLLFVGVTGSDEGLYKSADAGNSWVRCNNIPEISEIAVHPKNQDIIYISAIGSGVLRSTDGGKTWVYLRDDMPTTEVMRVRIAPTYPVTVYAVTLKHGIFRMVDEEIRKEDVMK